MAFFSIHRYRLFDDLFDGFFNDQLDFFDPCNKSNDGKNLATTSRPPNAEKYRVQLNVTDFNPEIIKIKVEDRKVIVEAKQEDRQPNNSKRLASYVTPNNMLVIEVPIHNPETEQRLLFFKSTTLPPGTRIDQLQSYLTDDGQLKIEAPYIEQKEATQSIENQKK
ncbi:unnamed protein product [Rotaria sp. Silwood2]|nr:unnamed protein product [Rotaria sp. Silwood2]